MVKNHQVQLKRNVYHLVLSKLGRLSINSTSFDSLTKHLVHEIELQFIYFANLNSIAICERIKTWVDVKPCWY